jgi:hypothetical protein
VNKHLLAGVVVALAFLGVGLWLAPEEKVEVPVQGALSGPDIQSTWLRVGGIRHEYRYAALNTATTTPCALQSPAATSTLTHASLQIQTATSTATVWTAAKAASAFATTTLLGQFSLGSGALGTMNFASSTVTAVTDDITVIAPNQYIVWGVQGTAISGTAKLNGVCQAEFIVIQ